MLKTKQFFSRKALNDIHNTEKAHCLKTFEDYKKALPDNELKTFLAKLKNSIETFFKQIYANNDCKRENIFKNISQICKDSYEQCMVQILKESCVEPNVFDKTSSENKSLSLVEFNKTFGDDKEFRDMYISKVNYFTS
jgi:hypothetical protein